MTASTLKGAIKGTLKGILNTAAPVFSRRSAMDSSSARETLLRFSPPPTGTAAADNRLLEPECDLQIVIPAYNVEAYLAQCMDSVLAQETKYTYRVILVDDGATDTTPAIADTYSDDPRVTVIHQRNKGHSGARNTGILEIFGKYIMFVDSDDFLLPGAIDALPTFPNGFPREVLDAFEKETGRGVLCNLPYSGTDVIRDYGEEQRKTGKWIVYTSADSVFQVAAHEEWIPLQELYDACRKARKILQGKYGVGRVIARPYVGDAEHGFKRTANRHDFSLEPPKQTMLDAVKAAGLDCLAVGKIHDIFAGRGDTEYVFNKSNADGMAHTTDYAARDFHGLCFVNLVDFDMLYGHRRDIDGYAAALTEFDRWLGTFLPTLGEDDVVMITADHGCDPSYTATTDHTREYVPLLVLGKGVKPGNLGTKITFADIAATVTDLLGVHWDGAGTSFAGEIL